MEIRVGDRVRVEGDSLYPDFTGTFAWYYWGGHPDLCAVRPDKNLVSIEGSVIHAGTAVSVYLRNVTKIGDEE